MEKYGETWRFMEKFGIDIMNKVIDKKRRSKDRY